MKKYVVMYSYVREEDNKTINSKLVVPATSVKNAVEVFTNRYGEDLEINQVERFED